jgi:hypothetical protein
MCLLVLALAAGCMERTDASTPVSPASAYATLDEAVFRVILGDVEGWVTEVRWSGEPWYSRVDFSRMRSAELARASRAELERRFPGAAPDTLQARRRFSVFVESVDEQGDSAEVRVGYEISWKEPCQWNSSSASVSYRFRRTGSRWVFLHEGETILGDPAPPPPPEFCRARPAAARGARPPGHAPLHQII